MRTTYAEFCHYLIYNNDNSLEIGPDVVYKRRRFEVPNYNKQLTSELKKQRNMSYIMELGDIKPMRDVINKLDLNI